MISKQMYAVLSKIPLPTEAIPYENLRSKCDDLNINALNHLLLQARSAPFNYIIAPSDIEEAIIALTEKGVAEIQDYEEREENRKITRETLEITQKSLTVAKIAMWTAIASAVVAVVSLIKQFL